MANHNQKQQRPGKVDRGKAPAEMPMEQPSRSGEIDTDRTSTGDRGGRDKDGKDRNEVDRGSVISNDEEVELADDDLDEDSEQVTGRHPSQRDRDLP